MEDVDKFGKDFEMKRWGQCLSPRVPHAGPGCEQAVAQPGLHKVVIDAFLHQLRVAQYGLLANESKEWKTVKEVY